MENATTGGVFLRVGSTGITQSRARFGDWQEMDKRSEGSERTRDGT
jgi:hypothetical protein